MSSVITINPVITQIAIRRLAYFGSSYLGNDLYFLKEFVDIMINVIGEEEIITRLKKGTKKEKEIGKKWYKPKGIKAKMKKLDKIIEQTKVSYDLLEDKTLKKKDNKGYGDFIEKAKKIPLIKEELYFLTVYIISITTLQYMTISEQLFKILEHKNHRAVGEIDKRRINPEMNPLQ